VGRGWGRAGGVDGTVEGREWGQCESINYRFDGGASGLSRGVELN
jgi:hypothetical protein